jgi:hypothetical protein
MCISLLYYCIPLGDSLPLMYMYIFSLRVVISIQVLFITALRA